MIKNTKYNGYTASPSDYESADGDLSMSIGIAPEDTSLRPIMQPEEVFELLPGERVVYIHEPSEGTGNYIIMDDTHHKLYWWKGTTEHNRTELLDYEDSNVYSISSVGKILIVLSKEINYYLYNNNTLSYKFLGNRIPRIPLALSLEYEFAPIYNLDGTTLAFSFNDTYAKDNQTPFSPHKETVISKFKTYYAKLFDKNKKEGLFSHPFYIRYAFRLYDGSLYGCSNPILMMPCTSSVMAIGTVRRTSIDSLYDSVSYSGYLTTVVSKIVYGIDGDAETISNHIDTLNDWKDIIQSIDFFVSSPIIAQDYESEDLVESSSLFGFTQNANFDNEYCIGKQSDYAYINNDNEETRYEYDFKTLKDAINGSQSLRAIEKPDGSTNDALINGIDDLCVITFPLKNDRDLVSAFEDAKNFYHLESIDVTSIINDTGLITFPNELTFKDGSLNILESKETLTNEFFSSSNIFRAKESFSYNNKTHFFDTSYVIDGEMATTDFIQFTGSPNKDLTYGTRIRLHFFLNVDGREVEIVTTPTRTPSYPTRHIPYLAFPNLDAYKVIIEENAIYSWDIPVFGTYYRTSRDIMLKDSAFLSNISHKFNGLYIDDSEYTYSDAEFTSVTSPEETRSFDVEDVIYMTDVNNPFVITQSTMIAANGAHIIYFASASKALSEGQFGQFPLYVFTSEGVWALELSQEGIYISTKPVTRDVALSKHGILQIDDAVLFTTERGIMLLSGSTSQCISEPLNSPDTFSPTTLPRFDVLLEIYNGNAGFLEQLTMEDCNIIPFLDFVRECRMLYDYHHQHIIAYNPQRRYAYVYSLRTKQWGMTVSSLTEGVNSYPEALAMSQKRNYDGTTVPILVDFSQTLESSSAVLLVTRPITFNDADTHKSIHAIIQRGKFLSDTLVSVLYGSNDLYNWHIVWSSKNKFMRGMRGTPYKAYRIALVGRMDAAESLFGFSADYETRDTNQLR